MDLQFLVFASMTINEPLTYHLRLALSLQTQEVIVLATFYQPTTHVI